MVKRTELYDEDAEKYRTGSVFLYVSDLFIWQTKQMAAYIFQSAEKALDARTLKNTGHAVCFYT